jgi:hypothetical protein
VATPVQGLLLDAASDLIERLAGELDDVEGVEHGGGVLEFVADRVVESGRGAVSSVSAGPFPRPAPRTGRATSTASGSPRGDARGQPTTVVVTCCGVQGVGMAVPR